MLLSPETKETFISKYLIAETANSTVQRIADMQLALVNPTKTDFSHSHTREGGGKWVELIFHTSEEKYKGISEKQRNKTKVRFFYLNSHMKPFPSPPLFFFF